MMYTAKQLQEAVESAIRTTRETTLLDERARVQNAIYLHANTQADENLSRVVMELLPFLYDQRLDEVRV